MGANVIIAPQLFSSLGQLAAKEQARGSPSRFLTRLVMGSKHQLVASHFSDMAPMREGRMSLDVSTAEGGA